MKNFIKLKSEGITGIEGMLYVPLERFLHAFYSSSLEEVNT